MSIEHIVCLGYAKCGTTLLDATFRKSSRVVTPLDKKEIKYFLSPQYPGDGSYDQYLAQFFVDGKVPDNTEATFEASPPYCHQDLDGFREVLARIRSTLPKFHAVLCFRHPVARAYSHYIHNLHNFAMHGDGVYGARNMLPSKVFRRSFRQMLEGDAPRIMTHYVDYLAAAYEVLGRNRVTLFFLESDTLRFKEWVAGLVGADAVEELGLGDERPNMVIPRRPVPNYTVKDEALIAFGSRAGELIRYEGLDHAKRRAILDSRRKWTLELEDGEVEALTNEYFADDLRQCAELAGDSRFSDYILTPPGRQAATLTPGSLLKTLHGV